jgi:hypothetical protein
MGNESELFVVPLIDYHKLPEKFHEIKKYIIVSLLLPGENCAKICSRFIQQ